MVSLLKTLPRLGCSNTRQRVHQIVNCFFLSGLRNTDQHRIFHLRIMIAERDPSDDLPVKQPPDYISRVPRRSHNKLVEERRVEVQRETMKLADLRCSIVRLLEIL